MVQKNWYVRFILSVLATYRLSEMLVKDDGPFLLIAHLRSFVIRKSADEQKYSNGYAWQSAEELFNCAHCMGVWVAAFFSLLLGWNSRLGNIIILILSMAGLQSFIQRLKDK